VFKVGIFFTNPSPQANTPFTDDFVNDALWETTSLFNDVVNPAVVDMLLQRTPNLVIDGVQV